MTPTYDWHLLKNLKHLHLIGDLVLTGNPNSSKFIRGDGSWAIPTVDVNNIVASGTPSASTYLRGDGSWATISVASGDVVGPSSAIDNALVRFDQNTGKLVKSSLYSTLDNNGQLVLTAGTASSIPATLRGASSQTGHLLLFQSSTPATLAYVDKSGYWNYNSPTSRNAFLNLKPVSESTSHYYLYAERYNGSEWFYVDTQANMRLWGTLLISARTNSIGTRALYAEKYGASGNVKAVEFSCIAPSSMTGNHIGVYFNSDVRPAASNFSGTLMAAKFYLYFEQNNATSSTGSLYGSYYTFDDQGLYGTLANLYLDYKDGMRLIRSTAVVTNFYGSYIKGDGTSHAGDIKNQYGLYIGNISLGSILKYAVYTNSGLVHFGDTVDLASGKNLTLLAGNITTDTTTGTKIGTATTQKLGFWNATPIVQPTTAVTASTFVANTSGIANDTATFDGYTIGQVVKALRNIGILA